MNKEIKEFKNFVDALTGKKEVDYVKTIFSNDDQLHFKRSSDLNSHDKLVDEFDSPEEFEEEYEDDFDEDEEAMDYYEDEEDL